MRLSRSDRLDSIRQAVRPACCCLTNQPATHGGIVKTIARTTGLCAIASSALLFAGCGMMPGASSKSSAEAPTATAQAAPANKTPPGMNANGEVVDISKVEGGHGQKVKGRDGWEGEITGKPAPGTKFTKLQIGMGMKEAMDLVGPPTDQGAYITGKAWIPFYFGSDRHRHELAYKGQGRLIFAGDSGFSFGSGHLVWIIHFANDTGYR
jgi:hypothetical protein